MDSMARNTIYLLLLFSLTAIAHNTVGGLWIVGENYVAFADEKPPPKYFQAFPTSWGFDRLSCRLWVVDKNTKKLSAFEPTQQVFELSEPVDAILSDIEENRFITKNGTLVQQRTDLGRLVQQSVLSWAPYSEGVVFHGKSAWSLNFDFQAPKFWLQHFSIPFSDEKEEWISSTLNTIAFRKILFEKTSGTIWLGYSVTNHVPPYSPVVEQRGRDMKLIQRHLWGERGLFFDFCAQGDGSVLVSRDRSSNSGYTVPLYSFLERFLILPPTKLYEGDVNLFIDSVTCRSPIVYMIQRSIFGSDGSHLVRWDRTQGTLGERLFRLPGRAHKIYECSAELSQSSAAKGPSKNNLPFLEGIFSIKNSSNP